MQAEHHDLMVRQHILCYITSQPSRCLQFKFEGLNWIGNASDSNNVICLFGKAAHFSFLGVEVTLTIQQDLNSA